jgi:transaldolase
MDPAYTLSMPIKPHDMTSNQGWVHEQMCNPVNEELFKSVVKEYKDKGWLAIYTRMVQSHHDEKQKTTLNLILL